MKEIRTHSAHETAEIGCRLGRACRGGEVILLEGDLGAGKTTLAQGLARGLDITAPIISPTFVILREYEGRLPLYHFDFYRLQGMGRAVDLEFEEYLSAGGVCVIEWPSCAPELIPPDYLRLTLQIRGDEERVLQLEAQGAQHHALVAALASETAGTGAAS